MNIFKIFFPYKLQLHIFQLDEYNLSKFLHWIFSHFFTRTIEDKKHFVFTAKARAIFYLAVSLALITLLIFMYLFGVVGGIGAIVLSTQAYIYLIVAHMLLLPYQIYKKHTLKLATEKKLASFPKLKVVGITGSYGKTSVKEFLYHILKTKYKVLRTPGSYNTPLGIAKVVDLELDNSYEFFLCEMGAYKRGEIKEICDMVHPTYGILTGINEQHIETFGSLENTTTGKFELIASLPKNGFGVVNGDNARIADYLENILKQSSPPVGGSGQDDTLAKVEPSGKNVQGEVEKGSTLVTKNIVTYGFSGKDFSITDIVQTHEGSKFILILGGKKYTATTKLLGKSNLQNILGAATMSYLLGMNSQDIIKAIATLESVAHRLEIKPVKGMTIIDDAYNSNVDGFQEAIALLRSFDTPKILVTPGIVDLGDRTIQIHESLGKLLGDIDYIFLVGESDRTKGLEMGVQDKKKIKVLASIRQVWEEIDKLVLKNPVILLENDLPDNY